MEQPNISIEPLDVMDLGGPVGLADSIEQPVDLESPQTPHEHPMPPLDPLPAHEGDSVTSLVNVEHPKVNVNEVAIPPNRTIRPARRVPEYLPDVNGEMWKVWPYPDVIELSTDYETEEEPLPPGAYRNGYMIENISWDCLISPWGRWTIDWVCRVLGATYIGRFAYQLYECWHEYVTKKPLERDPEADTTDTTEDEMRKRRLA